MGKPRTFTTIPVAMIADTDLTALDLRIAAVIALHDGMSAVKGKGGGCYAKNSTLASLARTDVTNFSKSLSKLMKKGYVTREPQLMDKRRFTLRVQYPSDESWRADQPTGERIDAETGEIVGEPATAKAEIVGDAESGNDGFSSETGGHYISLNEELDSEESEKLNSSEEAHLRDASFPPDDDCGQVWRVPDAIKAGKEAAEAGCVEWALKAHLPPNLEALPLGAQVSKLDKAFTAIGRDRGALREDERAKWTHMLTDIFETCLGGDDDATAQQALRLSEDMAVW